MVNKTASDNYRDTSESLFKGVTQATNQPTTEFKRVPALLSNRIYDPLTLSFL
jgi:hypothetical protein